MSSKLLEAIYAIVIQFKWSRLITVLGIIFLSSWGLTYLFEPNNEMVKPTVYWWHYATDIIRSGTSGYAPTTTGGRIVSTISSVGGSMCFFAGLCKVLSYGYEHSRKKRKGLAMIDKKDHIVLLGYKKGETDALISQLTSGHAECPDIVLCSRHLPENPHPEVTFVHGDTSSEEVMANASVAKARVIVISGHTDERALAVAIVANSHAGPNAHIVAYFESLSNARYLHIVNPRIECVSSLRPMLLAQAILNPGSTKVIRNLVSLSEPGNNYRIDIPAGVPMICFHLAMVIFHMEYKTILIGYAESHSFDAKYHLNPDKLTMIGGGMSLFYIADDPIDDKVDWGVFEREADNREIVG